MATARFDKPGSWPAATIGAVVMAILAALMLVSCHGSTGSARQAKTVTIASIAYPYHGQQTYNGLTNIVVRQGWLKGELAKRGVQLAISPVPTAVGGPLINEGFSGKRIDFAAYGDFPAIIAISGGVPLKLVVPVGQGSNSYLVVRNGLAANTIKDLKGKRIALHRGRPWELPFSKLLDANGLKLGDFTIVNINPAATPAALASGDVDAAFLLSDGLLLEKKHIGRVIWSTKQGPADWKMRAELFGRGDFVTDSPELTQIVVDAYVRAAAWAAQDANRAAVIADATRGAFPADVVAKDYDEPDFPWRERFSPVFTDAVSRHYHAVADYAFAHGLVRSKVDADALLDDRFDKQALRNQKLDGFWSATSANGRN